MAAERQHARRSEHKHPALRASRRPPDQIRVEKAARFYTRVEDAKRERPQYTRSDQIVPQDDVGEHWKRHEAERVQSPADDQSASGGREQNDEQQAQPRAERAWRGISGTERLPRAVGHQAVEKVSRETEHVSGSDAAEEIADQIADRASPCRRRSEQERANHRHRIRRTELGDARNDRHHLERDQDRGVERRRDRREHHHSGVLPHVTKLAHR